METLENGLQTHSGASLQSGCSVDADAWCKRALAREIVYLGKAAASHMVVKVRSQVASFNLFICFCHCVQVYIVTTRQRIPSAQGGILPPPVGEGTHTPWYRHLVVATRAGGMHPTGMHSCVICNVHIDAQNGSNTNSVCLRHQ